MTEDIKQTEEIKPLYIRFGEEDTELREWLRLRAERNRRSMNGEALAIFVEAKIREEGK